MAPGLVLPPLPPGLELSLDPATPMSLVGCGRDMSSLSPERIPRSVLEDLETPFYSKLLPLSPPQEGGACHVWAGGQVVKHGEHGTVSEAGEPLHCTPGGHPSVLTTWRLVSTAQGLQHAKAEEPGLVATPPTPRIVLVTWPSDCAPGLSQVPAVGPATSPP